MQVTRPKLVHLGLVPGAHVWRSTRQYPNAETVEGVEVLRLDAPIYFPNAPFLREKVTVMADRYEENHGERLTVSDMLSLLELRITSHCTPCHPLSV